VRLIVDGLGKGKEIFNGVEEGESSGQISSDILVVGLILG
jgi:hypothetical protein